ncbi:hypothetical protein B0O99DRAFT_260954 [Bisporella sp. PMI_857]|nr:hypothetical protein B0O99DRAFT_260954 [Bisporella sp. PMI_857]
MSSTRKFLDVIGLSYECSSIDGETINEFMYSCKPGEVVSFFVGPLYLGQCVGKPFLAMFSLMPNQYAKFRLKIDQQSEGIVQPYHSARI